MNREQLHQGQREAERRTRGAFIPPEARGVLRTFDGEVYRRLPARVVNGVPHKGGQVVRARPKVRGKAARKADKRARRTDKQPAISQKSDNSAPHPVRPPGGFARLSMGGRP